MEEDEDEEKKMKKEEREGEEGRERKSRLRAHPCSPRTGESLLNVSVAGMTSDVFVGNEPSLVMLLPVESSVNVAFVYLHCKTHNDQSQAH